MKKVSLTPPKQLFPTLPLVMVSQRGTSEEYRKDNVITVGRITGLTTLPPRLVISIKKSTFSYSQIRESEEFVVNFVNEDLLHAADWCGIVSGHEHDKFPEAGLTPEPIEGLAHARGIEESPLSLGCKLVHDISDYEGYGILIGEVVSVSIVEAALGDAGQPVNALLGAVSYDGIESSYLKDGAHLGKYGYTGRE